ALARARPRARGRDRLSPRGRPQGGARRRRVGRGACGSRRAARERGPGGAGGRPRGAAPGAGPLARLSRRHPLPDRRPGRRHGHGERLRDGGDLIGGGWPALILDEAANRWEVQEDSARGSLEVARAVYPPLAGCVVAERWAGIEAFTPDGLPMLGPVPGTDGLLVAAGFSG